MNTPKQSIAAMSGQSLVFDIGTIQELDILARDDSGAVVAVSPSIVIQLHTTGGLARAELPRSLAPTDVSIGDDVLVAQNQYGRWLVTQAYAASNKTQAGHGSRGFGSGMGHLARPHNLTAKITGSQLELSWSPVSNAVQYQIWQSATANPSTNDLDSTADTATILGKTGSTFFVSQASGTYFDDGYYYAVSAIDRQGKQSSLSAWVQPTFVGNPSYGMVSKNQSTVIPGSLIVCKSGSIIRSDFTSVDSPTTFTIDVCDPLGTHPGTAPFSNGDILRFVDVSGNVLWVTISSSSNQTTFWRYTVVKSNPGAGTNYTIKSGSAVENWGQSGQGIFVVSSDGAFGSGTLWKIITHAGAPWSSTTTQVSADSTGKIIFGAGVGIQDASGIYIVPDTSYTALRAYKFTDATGATDYSGLYAYLAGGQNYIKLASNQIANQQSYVHVLADAVSGKSADVSLEALGNNLGSQAYVDINAGSGVTSSIGILASTISLDGNLVLASTGVTLANGENTNVTATSEALWRITGPTGAFSIGSIGNTAVDKIVLVWNTTSQTMTIVNESGTEGTASRRIITDTGADVTAKAAAFWYDNTSSRWRVLWRI